MADFGRVGEAFVDIRANFGKFQSDLAGAQRKLGRSLQSIGGGLSTAGRTLSLGLTLPIVAAAAATVKLGVDFEREMTKITTLVGIGAERVKVMGKEVLALSKTVAVGPGELAKALFVVTSAGQRGAESMRILENAAKASAIGLGDTAEIARAVTSAINAYGVETLNAERATEILVATVREGNLEASDLAGSLGRVIGIAANVGVTFEQVGAFVATFTRVGVKAEEAVTSLRGALAILVKPTKGVRDALDTIGSSVEQLRTEISEKGIAVAFGDLVTELEKFGIEVAEVFPNVRALSGILATVGSQGEEFIKITNNIANSQGILREGFEETRKTAAFLFRQVLVELQSITAELGLQLIPLVKDTLLPALRGAVQAIGTVATAFGNLGPGGQKAVVAFLALAAALGPILIIVGPIVSGVGSLVIAFAAVSGGAAVAGAGALTFGGVMAGLLPVLASIAVAIGVVTLAAIVIFQGVSAVKFLGELALVDQQLERIATDSTQNVLQAFNALSKQAQDVRFPPEFGEELKEIFATFQDTGDIDKFRESIDKVGERMGDFQRILQPTQQELDKLKFELREGNKAIKEQEEAAALAAAGVAKLKEAAKELREEQEKSAEATRNALQPFKALTDQWDLAREAGTTAAEFTAAFRDQIEQAGVKADGSARLFAALGIEVKNLPPELREAADALRILQSEIDNTNISILALEMGIVPLGEGAARATQKLMDLGDGTIDLQRNVQRVNDIIDEQNEVARKAGQAITLLERDISDYRKAGTSAARIQEIFKDRIEESTKAGKTFGIELGKNTKQIEKDLRAKKENAEFAKKFEDEWKTAMGNVFGSFIESIGRMDFSFKAFGKNLVNTLGNLGRTLLSTFASAFFSPVLKAGQRFAENLADSIFSALSGGQGPAGGLFGGIGGSGGIGGQIIGGLKGVGTAIGGALKAAVPFLTNPLTAIPAAIGLAIFAAFKLFTQSPLEAGAKESVRDFGVDISESTLKGFTEGIGLTEKEFKPIRKDILSSPEAFKNLLLPAAEATGSVDELVASFGQLEAFGQVFDLSAEAAKAAGGDFEDFNKRFVEIFGGNQDLVRQFGADLSGLLVDVPEDGLVGEDGLPIVRTGELLGDVFVDRLDTLIEVFGMGMETLATKLSEIVEALTALISPDQGEAVAVVGGEGADFGGSQIEINIMALDAESFRVFMAGDGGDIFIEELLLRRSEQLVEVVKAAEKGLEE